MKTEKKHTFYMFSDNSSYNPQFTQAFRIHSKSEMVDRECPEYGVRENYPSGAFDVSVEGASQYPDVLGCGAYPLLIVSQAVIDDWKEAGIHAFHTYPVGIAKVDSKVLRSVPAPAYFRVEIDGRCQIDLEASGLRVLRYAPECHYLATEPMVSSGFKMVSGSWDGSPIFRDADLYPSVSFCTELILELAGKHKHINFRFEPMEGPFDNSSRGIDYIEG